MTDPETQTRRKLRSRWSHRHPVHRAIVRSANRVLPYVPFQAKYAATDMVRQRALPYRLLGSSSTAIQVGAPQDTLYAGRSRAMAFARRISPEGELLVLEPDAESAASFQRMCERHALRGVRVVTAAAWAERAKLTMEVDDSHPATNFTSGTTDYSHEERARFHIVTVEAMPLDDLVTEHLAHSVDVVSITTNGAEEEILRGAKRLLERDRPFICLARTRDSYSEMMESLGYELAGQDDRGFTFRPKD